MANMEKKVGARFNQAHPSYADMMNFDNKQQGLFDPDEQAIACFCGD